MVTFRALRRTETFILHDTINFFRGRPFAFRFGWATLDTYHGVPRNP